MVVSIGDILQLSRLAATLYTKGWLVARDAPQDFRDLVQELLLLKDVLFIVHRKVTREVTRDDDDDGLYSHVTNRVLQQCSGALLDFSVLVAKYEKLALSDRGHWFRRLQWSTEQAGIDTCRKNLQNYQRMLQLVLTPEGRTKLSEEAAHDAREDGAATSAKSCSPYLDEQSMYRDGPGTSYMHHTRPQTIDSAQTLVHSHNSPPLQARESFSQARPRSNQMHANAEAADVLSLQRSSSHFTEQSSLSDAQWSRELGQPSRFIPHRPSDASLDGRLRHLSFGTISSNDSFQGQPLENTVFPPWEISDRREKHDCPEELEAAFLQSFDSIGNEMLDESWIRVATWWLIKSQTVFKMLSSSTAIHHQKHDFHDYSHWENTTSKDQAYVDLLKASWILDELIRERKVAGNLTKPHIRKLVIDLMKAFKSDLHYRQRDKSFGGVPATPVLLEQDLSLLESFEQMVEAKENEPRAMDDLTTSQRWITIDKDHGGFEGEHVLFRSFVNAQIGQRHERSKSSDAPYIILLWTKAGESEINVSLCNQRDTMNLSRKMTVEDLEFGYQDAEAANRGHDVTALHLDFPSQPAEINFLAASDANEFRKGPKRFFDAVKGRDPRPGELTVFSTVLKSYRNVNVTTSSASPSLGDHAHSSFDSCELRLYEQMDETCWKSFRRLVVSSSADSKKLGSVSHWLPMSNVRVQVEDTTVTISWSDCAHLEKKSGGNYNPYYSFVYRPDTPNQKVILLFNDSEAAQRFEDCVLYLTETPPQVRLVNKLDSTSAFQETRIYSLYDQDDPDRGYHGIVYAKKSPKTYHFSQICYIYRDLDFSFLNQNASEIELQNVRAPQYISTRHKMLSRPKDSDAPPEFREVTSVFWPVQLTFSTDDDAVQFLSGLTGWRLKFYKQCAKLVATDTSHFHKPKKTYKNAEISLWEKSASEVGSLTQLLVRLPEMDRPWITAMLESSGGGLGLPSGGVAELKNLVIQQGKDLDTKHMKANCEETNSKHCWKFTITFKIASGLSLGDPRPRYDSNISTPAMMNHPVKQ
ncbi:MAG: hypothetical protein Q9180_002650 [Flavoplaca navasiana]